MDLAENYREVLHCLSSLPEYLTGVEPDRVENITCMLKYCDEDSITEADVQLYTGDMQFSVSKYRDGTPKCFLTGGGAVQLWSDYYGLEVEKYAPLRGDLDFLIRICGEALSPLPSEFDPDDLIFSVNRVKGLALKIHRTIYRYLQYYGHLMSVGNRPPTTSPPCDSEFLRTFFGRMD